MTDQTMYYYEVNFNTRYSMDVDYRTDNSNCQCDYMCRCSVITNTQVHEPHCEALMAAIEIKRFPIPKKGRGTVVNITDPVKLYCIYGMLNFLDAFNPSSYEVIIGGGYYGQEIADVRFDRATELTGAIALIVSCDTDEETISTYLNIRYAAVSGLDDGFTVSVEKCEQLADAVDNGPRVGKVRLISREAHVINLPEPATPIGLAIDGEIIEGADGISAITSNAHVNGVPCPYTYINVCTRKN